MEPFAVSGVKVMDPVMPVAVPSALFCSSPVRVYSVPGVRFW